MKNPKKLKVILAITVSLFSVSGCFKKRVNQQNENYFSAYKSIKGSLDKITKNEIKFVAFGDFGTGDANQYKVAKAVEDKCKEDGCDFGLLLGDNFYENGIKGENDPQFDNKFARPYTNLNFNFYATLGNHDYRGDTQAQIDYSAKNPKWVLPGVTYSFSEGFIDFFSIDSNVASEKQGRELENAINKSKASWKIVFGHHPRYSNGFHGNAYHELARMLDKTICNKADMYLSGHDHNKEYLKKVCNVEYLVVGSGGANPRGITAGQNTIFAKSSLGFAWFKVSKENMEFQLIDEKGNLEYKTTIKKRVLAEVK